MEDLEALKKKLRYSVGYDKENKGLENALGANNWFLNVVIQSLWHLASFRKMFKWQSLHTHKEGKIISKKVVDLSQDQNKTNISEDNQNNVIPVEDIIKNISIGMSIMDVEDKNALITNEGALHADKVYLDFGQNPNLSDSLIFDYFTQVNTSAEEKKQVEVTEENKDSKKEYVPAHLLSYPIFDEMGNIIEGSFEAYASIDSLPIQQSFVDVEYTLEECWLFCNLLTLFIKYEFEESDILAPLNVRQALDSITGRNDIFGYKFGSMGCAQETFQAILEYLHREYIKPNYFEEYCEDPNALKVIEDTTNDTGWSLNCVSHHVFGLEIGEFLSWSSWGYLSDVESTHLDFIINLYSEELISLDYSSDDGLDTLIYKMYSNESSERIKEQKIWTNCNAAPLIPKQMNLFSEPKVFTFAMNWNNPDNVSRESLTKILKIITPLIDAKMFMKIESPVEKKSIFVFRGFITYSKIEINGHKFLKFNMIVSLKIYFDACMFLYNSPSKSPCSGYN